MEEAKKTIWVDVTELMSWIGPVVGILRVMEEISTSLLQQYPEKIHYCFYDRVSREFIAIPEGIVRRKRQESRNPRSFYSRVYRRVFPLYCRLLYRRRQSIFRANDVLLLLGAPWNVPHLPKELQHLQQREELAIVFLIYDIIPIKSPHFFAPHLSSAFRQCIPKMVSCSEILLTISNHSAKDLRAFIRTEGLPERRVEVIRLADEILEAQRPVAQAKLPEKITEPFVLCVGTVESRKNPELLYKIWVDLAKQYSSAQIPTLVFVGRIGYAVEQFLRDVKNDPLVSGKIILLQGIEDIVLSSLYRNALFTVYPSFYEGWGLPIAESLNYGKYCIASSTSSMPEVGGDLIDYADPCDQQAWYTLIERAIFHSDYVHVKEAHIRTEFKSTSWQETARQIAQCCL